MTELDEFFSYAEIPSLADGLESFERDFDGGQCMGQICLASYGRARLAGLVQKRSLKNQHVFAYFRIISLCRH